MNKKNKLNHMLEKHLPFIDDVKINIIVDEVLCWHETEIKVQDEISDSRKLKI